VAFHSVGHGDRLETSSKKTWSHVRPNKIIEKEEDSFREKFESDLFPHLLGSVGRLVKWSDAAL